MSCRPNVLYSTLVPSFVVVPVVDAAIDATVAATVATSAEKSCSVVIKCFMALLGS